MMANSLKAIAAQLLVPALLSVWLVHAVFFAGASFADTQVIVIAFAIYYAVLHGTLSLLDYDASRAPRKRAGLLRQHLSDAFWFLLSVPTFHIFIVLFGASLSERAVETLYLSLTVASCIVWRLLRLGRYLRAEGASDDTCTLLARHLFEKLDSLSDSKAVSENEGETTPSSRASRPALTAAAQRESWLTVAVCVCVLLGTWCGATVVPLDWDRTWQSWPLSCLVGAFLGNFVAHCTFLLAFLFNDGGAAQRKKKTMPGAKRQLAA